MYCQNCGKEIGKAKFCPNCGAAQPDDDLEPIVAAPEEPVYERVYFRDQDGLIRDHWNNNAGASLSGRIEDRYRAAFKDPVYLAITIIITVTMVLSVYIGIRGGGIGSLTSIGNQSSSGGSYSIGGESSSAGGVNVLVTLLSGTTNIFPILFTIALWLIFGSVRKNGRIPTAGYTMASGTLKAIWIITWVALGLSIVGMLIIIIIRVSELSQLSQHGLSMFDPGFDPGSSIDRYGSAVVVLVVCLIILLVICIAAVIMLICYKKLHNFARSVCVSLKTGTEDFRSVRGARAWLIVLAVFSFIGAVFSVFSFIWADSSGFSISAGTSILTVISSLLTGIAEILAASMIKTHFLKDTYY